MNLLLDTHCLLWFLADDPRLSTNAKAAIENPANRSFVSLASCWEIAIKLSLGRLTIGKPFAEVFPAELDRNGIEQLPIAMSHLQELLELPWHHRDPFDRIIVAQTRVESLKLISRDGFARSYGIEPLW
ncbi:MAG TPA: type II toxin-antitoxin system VapC family toxin [Pirellulaceae bacterium]|nr:type II toxin-antitoxin system VapC family toxin [Pirellulaceae bacterium]